MLQNEVVIVIITDGISLHELMSGCCLVNLRDFGVMCSMSI